MVDNMQIINGCQTVNALYHAKYDAALKDKFQGNSNVLLRIYHIDPANQPFMEALIIATNSQTPSAPKTWLPMIHRKRNWRRNSARRPCIRTQRGQPQWRQVLVCYNERIRAHGLHRCLLGRFCFQAPQLGQPEGDIP